MTPPQRLSEHGPAIVIRRKLNEVIEYMKTFRMSENPDIRWVRTPLGTIPTVMAKAVAGEVSTRDIQRFKITEVSEKWLVCRKVNKNDDETDSVDHKVMRPEKLRVGEGLPSDYKEDSLVEDTDQTRTFDRTVSGVDYTVSQEIYPRYAADDFIYGANEITGGTVADDEGEQLEWIDLNIDGRHWQYSMREIEVCVDNAIKKAIAQISEGED